MTAKCNRWLLSVTGHCWVQQVIFFECNRLPCWVLQTGTALLLKLMTDCWLWVTFVVVENCIAMWETIIHWRWTRTYTGGTERDTAVIWTLAQGVHSSAQVPPLWGKRPTVGHSRKGYKGRGIHKRACILMTPLCSHLWGAHGDGERTPVNSPDQSLPLGCALFVSVCTYIYIYLTGNLVPLSNTPSPLFLCEWRTLTRGGCKVLETVFIPVFNLITDRFSVGYWWP